MHTAEPKLSPQPLTGASRLLQSRLGSALAAPIAGFLVVVGLAFFADRRAWQTLIGAACGAIVLTIAVAHLWRSAGALRLLSDRFVVRAADNRRVYPGWYYACLLVPSGLALLAICAAALLPPPWPFIGGAVVAVAYTTLGAALVLLFGKVTVVTLSCALSGPLFGAFGASRYCLAAPRPDMPPMPLVTTTLVAVPAAALLIAAVWVLRMWWAERLLWQQAAAEAKLVTTPTGGLTASAPQPKQPMQTSAPSRLTRGHSSSPKSLDPVMERITVLRGDWLSRDVLTHLAAKAEMTRRGIYANGRVVQQWERIFPQEEEGDRAPTTG